MSRYKVRKYPPKNGKYVGKFYDKDTGDTVLMYTETNLYYVVVDKERKKMPQWYLRKKERKGVK